MSEAVNIRRELRTGDLAAIVALHGRLYSDEYGVDPSFEAFVSTAVDRAAKRGWPSEREAVWIAERHGAVAGCLAMTDEGDGIAMLRWFVLEPSLRGQGLGRRLVGELLAVAQTGAYRLVRLETFSELQAAAHLYRAYGFEVVSAETAPRWGREEITYQRYELQLPPANPAQSATHAVARGA
jgi:ribosomal protein S18 acetylase RimI-like enzyme